MTRPVIEAVVVEEGLTPVREKRDPAEYVPTWVTLRDWDTARWIPMLISESGPEAVAHVLRDEFEWLYPHGYRPPYVAAAMAPRRGETANEVISRLVDGIRLENYFASGIVQNADRALKEFRLRR